VVFEQAGLATLAPGWTDVPTTVEQANAKPDVFAGPDHHSPITSTQSSAADQQEQRREAIAAEEGARAKRGGRSGTASPPEREPKNVRACPNSQTSPPRAFRSACD
jgi:hypothetical protein